jgi:tetratricopeptide (TPR) repeat protein
MRSFSAALFVGLIVTGAPARSATPALALYAEGEYLEAMEAGEAEGGSSGFTLVARAAIADAELRDAPCHECLMRAEEFAQLAIAADGENAEAHILLVTALGRRARIIGFLAAQREAIASRTDDAITTALHLDPASAFAHALRGAWHIEIVNLAGRFLGRVLYGADFEEGRRFYRQAIKMDPQNLVIRYQYALSLDGYDFESERTEIEAALEAAIADEPADAYEEAIKERAQMLFDLLQEGEDDAFRERMRQFRGEM